MLRSIKELFGDKLGASDGEIGQRRNGYVALVKDEFGGIQRHLVSLLWFCDSRAAADCKKARRMRAFCILEHVFYPARSGFVRLSASTAIVCS